VSINLGQAKITAGDACDTRRIPFQSGASAVQKLKKSYTHEKYGVEEAEKKYAEWDKLKQQLFIRRK
jgi:hypothetical protein